MIRKGQTDKKQWKRKGKRERKANGHDKEKDKWQKSESPNGNSDWRYDSSPKAQQVPRTGQFDSSLKAQQVLWTGQFDCRVGNGIKFRKNSAEESIPRLGAEENGMKKLVLQKILLQQTE